VKGFHLNINSLLAPPSNRSRLFIFLIHWMAWTLLHFITYLPTLINSRIVSVGNFLYVHFLLITINFLLFYIVAFFIMPLMDAFKKKWFWMVIAALVLAIAFTYLRFRIEMYHADQTLRNISMFNKFPRKTSHEAYGFFSYRFRSYFQANILTNVSIVVAAFAYRLLLIWLQQEKIRTELQNQKLSAELSFLKMQVNPHFLFNALNNIYSLSVIENTNKTSNSILKLSDLMRYMLYEKEDEQHKVSLEKEIKHINNYIDLEKLRHADEMCINFSIEGDLNGKKIAPLLLFPLIENAFKHGLVTDSKTPINIQIEIIGSQMHFLLENFKNTYQKDVSGGIGVQNVKKRLDLIYGDSYTLRTTDTKDRYIVDLNLPL
jgi:two-component system, LytTR family, sensor kinase